MLIVLQFPVSDSRPFGADREIRLDLPQFPHPVTEITPEFVHFFGRAVERTRGADSAWTDEISFCLARRAIRFNDLAVRRLGPPALGFRPAAAFRRLFSDGRAVARLEIGIRQNESIRKLGALDEASLIQLAADTCMLPTWVPQHGVEPRAWKPLLRQGKAAAELYGRATSRQDASPTQASHAHDLVRPGRPLLLIELSDGESKALPDTFLPASFITVTPEKTRQARASFGRLRTRAGVVNAWVIRRGDAARMDLRSLRLCLMRLHAEQEALDIVIQHIRAGRLPDTSNSTFVNDLDDYLNRATRLIKRESWSGVSQSAILEAYDAAEEVTPSANRLLQHELFDGARLQVSRKIEEFHVRRAAIRVVPVTYVAEGGTYVEKNVTTNVSGKDNIVTINVADYMRGVTTNVTQNLSTSAAPADVQELVKTLTKQIEAIATRIEPAKTKEMGADVQALSTELANTQRRKWYQLSLEGLKEAAEAVGEVGKPILETVKALWPLLLP